MDLPIKMSYLPPTKISHCELHKLFNTDKTNKILPIDKTPK